MIDKYNMTIDAYLRQAGLKPRTVEKAKNFIALKPIANTGFDQVLNAVETTGNRIAGSRDTGMTISDYLGQRTSHGLSALFNGSTRRGGALGTGSLSFDTLLPGRVVRKPATEATDSGNAATGSGTGQEARIASSVKKAAQKYNLPEALINNVIRAESNFQPDAVSPAGAQGLMQLMPATARELGVNDAFDISQNIDGGSRYLRQMLDRFDGDVRLALAAYNAGPGTVDRYGGEVPPYKETQAYVRRILAAMSPTEDAVA